MAAERIIKVYLYDTEIGRLGLDETHKRSSFQYNPAYLDSNELHNVFPNTGIIKRIGHVQLFSRYDNKTFRALPPQLADSLPDLFGSIIFKAWLETREQPYISVLEQLAYVGCRGMGALEYRPVIDLPKNTSVDLEEIIGVLKQVMQLKNTTRQTKLDSQALVNIFKIGTSAGGARPKILISEHKKNGNVIPGDLEYSDKYHHYLVKLAMEEDYGYPREIIEYCYYLAARAVGIRMMDSKLIDDKHFATLRYDRIDGNKIHTLTATGLTGWHYEDPEVSSYENLFKLCSFLKIPHAETEELFRRMVFNVLYGNVDDHLKNHAFTYDRETARWHLSPAYDLTYALNPLLEIHQAKRALSINGKRADIMMEDLISIADTFTIKNPKGVIKEVKGVKESLMQWMKEHDVPAKVTERMQARIQTGLRHGH